MKVTLVSIAILLGCCAAADGAVVQYTNKSAWQNAVGAYTTIDFVGGQDGFPILPMHSTDLGVTFTGQQLGYFHSSGLMPNDGEGIRGSLNDIWVAFDTPQKYIAAEFPGGLRIALYSGETLLYTSSYVVGGGGGLFIGLISDVAFDKALLYRPAPTSNVYIDDIHFGVPAPGALGVFALVVFASRGRWRTRGDDVLM
ncbi:MAG TPA: hypothetical protein PK098_12830 [Phycisphaerales bacterium]|nr:hypothetical protein [Phycisphaerales bacterium]